MLNEPRERTEARLTSHLEMVQAESDERLAHIKELSAAITTLRDQVTRMTRATYAASAASNAVKELQHLHDISSGSMCRCGIQASRCEVLQIVRSVDAAGGQ